MKLRPRQMARFARGWLGGRFLGRPATVFVSYAVTGRCTRDCAYCNGPGVGEELRLDAFLPVLDDLVAHGLVRMGFTGGEPLLHPDLGEMLRACRERGVLTVVSTNGDLVPSRIDELRAADWVSVSLDGTTVQHDGQRGSGSHAAATDAIEALVSAGIPTVTSTVIGPHDDEAVDGILSLASRWGVQTVWQPPFYGPVPRCAEDPTPLDDATLQRVVARLLEESRRRRSRVAFGPAYYEFLRRNYPHYAPQACPAGFLFWGLGSDGRAYRCFPFIGQGEGVDLTRRSVAELLEGAAPAPCGAGCFCSGHVANQLLFEGGAGFWWSLLRKM